jgi:glycosyltransferase involved in cell wall biosynthesis
MKSPSVSVVLPARNAESTLGEAIESLRRQDLADFEIILIDHGSKDATHKLMQQAAADDSRIRVHQCHGTFVEAANLAWRSANGDLIARMDSDDVSAPSRLRLQRDFLIAHPELSACASLVRILRRTEEGATLPPEGGYSRYETWINTLTSAADISAQRFIDSPLPNPTTMMYREVLESLGGYPDPPWAEDYDFWLRFFEKGYLAGKVPATLLDWYDGDSRSTRTLERYSLTRFQEAKAHYLARLPGIRESGVVICGAGPTGKEMAALLRKKDVPIRAFIEVNPKQIGNRIAGSPVLSTDSMGRFTGNAVALGAVARPEGRNRIRKMAIAAGFAEGSDFFCVA